MAAFAGGLAAELSTFGEGFGYLTCRGAECRDLDAQLRPRQIGGGISMALGAAGVIGGAIVLVQGGNERKAALRQLSLSVAPGAGGGTGTVSFRF